MAAALAVAGCTRDPSGPQTTTQATSPSTGASSATKVSTAPSATGPSLDPRYDLTQPGVAEQAVTALRERTNHQPVVRLDITATTATLSILHDNKPQGYAWTAGTITHVDTDFEAIDPQVFDPSHYRFTKVAELFAQAAVVSGSKNDQRLQIVQRGLKTVQMVVTTVPETETVFFTPDGTLIPPIDMSTNEGLAQALREVIDARPQVLAIGRTGEIIFADAPDPANPQSILRVSRTNRAPAFTASIATAPSTALFSPTELNVQVLQRQIAAARVHSGAPETAVVNWVVDMRDDRPLPSMRFTVNNRTLVTDTTGRDITGQV